MDTSISAAALHLLRLKSAAVQLAAYAQKVDLVHQPGQALILLCQSQHAEVLALQMSRCSAAR